MTRFLASLWGRLRPQRGPLMLLLLMLFADIAFDSAFPLSFKFLIDDAIVPRDGGRLGLILSVLVVSAGVFAVASIAMDYLAARISADVINGMRMDLYKHLQRLPVSFFERTGSGDVTARFTGDLGAVENALGTPLPVAVLSAFGLLISIGLLFTLQWQLALVGVAGLPLAALTPRVIGRKAGDASFDLREEQGRLADIVNENANAQPVVKAFGLEAAVVRSFADRLAIVRTKAIRTGFLTAMLERVPNVALLVFHLAALWVGSWLAFRGSISIGALASFNAILLNMSLWMNAMTYAIPEVVRAAAGYRRIDEILREEPDVIDRPGAPALPQKPDVIEFDDVSFAYPDGRAALTGVTASIRRGTFVAVVGPSGSGKSTLIRLLLRFQDPAEGVVRAGGYDLRSVTLESWRSNVGVVFQENVLFDISIRENIRLGRLDATDAEIDEAVRLAELDPVIESLPDGLDTVVGARGGHVSGGERQRVALARAIVRSPDVLVLDEATSALDPRTEAQLNRTIDRLRAGRTIITSTHRLSSIAHADQIIVLSKGRVAEQGTHLDLLARDGLYRQLWDKQAGIMVDVSGTKARVEPERLAKIPVMAVLDPGVRAEVAGMLIPQSVPMGRDVFVEGESADTFYLIAHGRVEVIRSIDGEPQRIATLDEGDHFGEVALVRNDRRTATVRTLTPAMLLTLRRDQLLDLIGRNEALRAAVEDAVRDRT